MKLTFTKYLITALLLLSIKASAQLAYGSSEALHSYQIPRQSLTLGLASAFSGYTPLYYERKINKGTSLQIGAGVTYHSYLYGARSDQPLTDNYHRKATPGLYFESAIKFYPSGNCMNGFFFSPTVSFFNYNYRAQMVNELTGNYNDEYQHEYRNVYCFALNIGHHLTARNGGVFSWNFGFGLQAEQLHYLEVDQTFHKNYTRNETQYLPRISINIAVGGIF